MSDSFAKTVSEFVQDLVATFPEIKDTLHPSLAEIEKGAPADHPCFAEVKEFVTAFDPKRTYSVLTEDATLFQTECVLLPGVDFAVLWGENITEKTKATIWRYLKLVIMSAVGPGGAAMPNFQETIEAASKHIHDIFENNEFPEAAKDDKQFENLIQGKLGDLAKEIAQETVDGNSEEQMQDMLKNPSRLFEMVNMVGKKIDSKIQSGELKETELMEEATKMLSKVNEIPGFENLFKQFAGGAKVDTAGMKAKMNQNAKKAKVRERLQSKLKKKREAPIE